MVGRASERQARMAGELQGAWCGPWQQEHMHPRLVRPATVVLDAVVSQAYCIHCSSLQHLDLHSAALIARLLSRCLNNGANCEGRTQSQPLPIAPNYSYMQTPLCVCHCRRRRYHRWWSPRP